MSVGIPEGYDEDRWGTRLCDGSWGGSASAGSKNDGNDTKLDVEIEGHLSWEADNGSKITGSGSYSAEIDHDGNTTQEGKITVRGDFPFIKI